MFTIFRHSFSPSSLSQAFALLADYIDNEDSSVQIGAIMGLGIAYAGSQKDQVNTCYLLTYKLS